MEEAHAPARPPAQTPSAQPPPAQPPPAQPPPPARWGGRIVVAAALLGATLIIPRISLLWRSPIDNVVHLPLRDVHKMIISGAYDVAYAFGLAAVFLLVLIALKRISPRRGGKITFGLFLVAAVLSLLAGMMNPEVVRTLGRPFNYPWLYYSDFLRSTDSHTAIQASLNWRIASAIVSTCAAYLLISIVLGKVVDRFTLRFSATTRRTAVACLVAGVVVYVAGSHRYLTSRYWPREKLINPVVEFAHSAVFTSTRLIFTMKTSFGDEDFAPPKQPALSNLPTTRPQIRHVVLFVLESTPAEYVGVYGSKYPATPNIDRWSKHAAVFENFYSHAPATNKTLFSLLASAYPWISFKAETEEKPDIALPSLVEQLETRGELDSGMFYSGDLAFQGAGEFSKHCGFDFLQDYKQRRSTRKVFTNEDWPFLNGSDDISTAEALVAWLAERRQSRTFTMLWTMMTHYPYFSLGNDKPLGPTENSFNVYLNALLHGDEAFGTLMNFLEKEKLLDETLVVVVGDHGEAFGRHNQRSHGNKIYEENCHVPLLLINPKLFNGERYSLVGGMVDVAPTITDILGTPAAATWQGRSLFSPDRSNRTYFFAPWSDMMFGYRDGSNKFIYNASKESYELYDLAADPTEQNNLISTRRDEIDEHVQRIAAWVQYQNRMFDRLLASP